jgi:hypothetical protein
MQYGLQIGGGDYQTILRWAKWAERRDFTGFGIPDHYLRATSDLSEPALEAGRDPEALLVAGETETEYRDQLAFAAEVLAATPEELDESFRVRRSPRGTWDQVRGVMAGLEAAGMERFWIQSLHQFKQTPGDIDHMLDSLGAN